MAHPRAAWRWDGVVRPSALVCLGVLSSRACQLRKSALHDFVCICWVPYAGRRCCLSMSFYCTACLRACLTRSLSLEPALDRKRVPVFQKLSLLRKSRAKNAAACLPSLARSVAACARSSWRSTWRQGLKVCVGMFPLILTASNSP